MNKEKLNAKDLLKIASSQWASARDIMTIGSVGRNKAYAIRNEIIADYYEGNKKVRNRRLVPMSEVLKYFNINIDYLQEVASYDKQ